MFQRLLVIVTVSGLFPALSRGQETLAHIDAPVVVGSTQIRFQKLGDINGDGFTDAFSAWWVNSTQSAARISAHINDGTGRFAQTWDKSLMVTPSDTAFWAVASGDVDADGLADFVFGAGAIVNLLRTGPGGSAPVGNDSWFPMGGLVHGVAIFNADDDPEREIAVVHGDLTLLDGIAGGAPTTLQALATLPLGLANGEVLAADLDADGERDLLVWDATTVQMVLVKAGILLPPYATFLHGCADPRAQVGDLDGDGDEDVVVFDTSTYRVLRRTGPTSWSPEATEVGGPARYLYDVDGDGDLDGTCCGGGGGPVSVHNVVPSFFRITLNDGTGRFAPAISFPGLGSERLAGAADLDHDGDLDLVAGRCVYYMPGRIEDGAPRPVPVVDLRPGMSADCDGDSDPDLDPGLGARRNLGDGSFVASTPMLPAPPAGCSYHGSGFPGDFDGDGDVDLVVGMMTNGWFDQMRFLRNAGGGSFTDAGPAGPQGYDFSASYLGPSARDSLARDADGDGDVDLIVRGSAAPNWSSRIFWNDGSGSFTAGPAWALHRIDEVADINRDGRPDLIGFQKYASGFDGDLKVIAGAGGGSFGPDEFVMWLDSEEPWKDVFDVGDADGDGDLDIVGVSVGRVTMFHNMGMPSIYNTFQESILFYDVLNSIDLAAGRGAIFSDVNLDGRLDVVSWPVGHATGWAPNAARVFLRRADNTGYEAPFLQLVRPTVSTDIDGDGDEDLLGAYVHKNRSFEGLDGGLRRQGGGAVAGAGGVVPTLGAVGPFRGIGSPIEMRLSGATGGVHGLWHFKYLADEPPPGSDLPSAVLQRYFPPVPMTTSGTPGAVGAGSWSLTFPVPSIAIGRTKRYWVTLQDTWSPTGTARSNDLFVTYGP